MNNNNLLEILADFRVRHLIHKAIKLVKENPSSDIATIMEKMKAELGKIKETSNWKQLEINLKS